MSAQSAQHALIDTEKQLSESKKQMAQNRAELEDVFKRIGQISFAGLTSTSTATKPGASAASATLATQTKPATPATPAAPAAPVSFTKMLLPMPDFISRVAQQKPTSLAQFQIVDGDASDEDDDQINDGIPQTDIDVNAISDRAQALEALELYQKRITKLLKRIQG